MATTDDSKKKDATDFEAAYAEEVKPREETEEQAFGLTPAEAPGTGAPTGSGPDIAIVVDDVKKDEGAAGPDAAADPAGTAQAPADAAGSPAALDVEKETQRLKSWEGRLKAREAELADKGKADPAPAAVDPDAEKADIVADVVAELDADPDMKALADDFGPEFVQLLTAVISKVAKKCAMEHTAPYRQDIDKIIADLTNEKQRAHYEKIADAHPDFLDIANAASFKAWIDGMEPAAKAEHERIAEAGTAKEIIAMLDQYKKAIAPAKSPDADMEFAMDNAEGVRSTGGGIKLPAQPAKSDDYEKAWLEN